MMRCMGHVMRCTGHVEVNTNTPARNVKHKGKPKYIATNPVYGV